jgi:hypothetical protein
MGKTLDNFKSQMTSFARPNLFEVMIMPPVGDKNNIQRMNIACHTCNVPGKTILTTDKDMPQAGYKSIAYQKTYEDVTMQFYLHADMKELKVFQDWTDLMIKPATNHVGYYDRYKSDVRIINLDRQQKKTLTTTLYEAYPKTITALDLSYGSNDEIMSISVTFTYRYYTQVFGERQEIIESGYDNNSEEVDVQNVVANDPSAILDKTHTLKVGQGIRSGGTGLLDFRGAE